MRTSLFPSTIFIEPATACNLRCRMCPCHGGESRVPPRFMNMDLYLRILDEAAAHDSSLGEISINPQLRGESLLHPEFPRMLKSARERGLRITLSTNGTLLRGDNLEAVAECADYVFISLDAASPEIYRAIRGVDYRLAAEGVEALFARRGHAKRPGIYMAYVKLAENEGEIDEFFRKWSGRADGILYYQERLPGGWYDRPNIPEPVVRPPCPHLTGSCAVMVDGKVTPCCFVVSDDDALGTIADGSALEEVYNGLGFTHLRRIHEERRFSESPLCRACNAYAGYGPPEDGGGDFMILRNSFTTFILKKEH